VVDDEEGIRSVVESFLEGNFSVKTAEHADKAIEMIRQNNYNLIITDYQTRSSQDGLDVILEAAKKYGTLECRVILMTADPRAFFKALSDEVERPLQLFIKIKFRMLAKPFELEYLREMVDDVMKG